MKVILTKPYKPYNQRMIVTMPLSLLYVASYLKKSNRNVEVEVLDPDVFNGEFKDFIRSIADRRPDIVGISMFSSLIGLVKEMITALKAAIPNVTVILGGSHINSVRDKVFRHLPEA
ncbi:MAG: cobalamin B12-binding domain-containing protein, partial [Nitrospirota bacterium]